MAKIYKYDVPIGNNATNNTTSSSVGSSFVQNVNSGDFSLDTHYFWGQPYNGTQDVNGDLTIGTGSLTLNDGNVYINYATNEDDDEQTTGNLYVQNDVEVGENLSAKNGKFDNLYSNFLDAVNGQIENLSGDKLDFVEGIIKDLLTTNITTEYLTVTKQAHFFELIIDKIKSAGGAVILTPADGFKVDEVTHAGNAYILRWRSEQEGRRIKNMWEVGDQALCQTFNAAEGVNYNISNKFYWALVTQVGSSIINGVEYNEIYLSLSDFIGTLNPEVGDEIVMLGHRGNDTARQSAIYISAYNSIDETLTAPLFCHYKGINDFNLSRHKYTWFAANGNTIRGNLKVESGVNVEDIVRESADYMFNMIRGTKDYENGDFGPLFFNKDHVRNDDELIYYELPDWEILDVNVDLSTLDRNWENKTYTLSFLAKSDEWQSLHIDLARSRIIEDIEIDDVWRRYTVYFNGLDMGGSPDICLWFCEPQICPVKIAEICLREGHYEPKDAYWIPAINELYSDETTTYRIQPRECYATVNSNNNLEVRFDLNIVKNVGKEIINIDFQREGFTLYWVDDRDWGDTHEEFKVVNDRTLNTLYENKGLVQDYGSREGESPTKFLIVLCDKVDYNKIYDTITVNVFYSAFASFEINNSILSRVRNNEGKLSEIEQTAEQIRLQVEDINIQINNRKIILNGDTEINGTLTLNDEESGFLLNGVGGQTLISPKSIGTLKDFKELTESPQAITLNTITEYFGTNNDKKVSNTYKSTFNLGYIGDNNKIKVEIQNRGLRYITNNIDSDGTPLGEYRLGNVRYNSIVLKNDTGTYSKNISTTLFNNQFEEVVPNDGNYLLEVTYYIDFTSVVAVFNNPQLYIYPKIVIVKPIDKAYTIIGYDGIATSFGDGRYLFFGADATHILYHNVGLKIAADGIKKETSNITIDSRDTAKSEFVSDYSGLNNATRLITSGGISYVNDTDDIIIIDRTFNASMTAQVEIYLPVSNFCIGRRLTFYCSDNSYISLSNNKTNVNINTQTISDRIYYSGQGLGSSGNVNHQEISSGILNLRNYAIELLASNRGWVILGTIYSPRD